MYRSDLSDRRLTERTKIFGIGLNKTGTSSLKQAIEILGFGPAVSQREVARAGLVNEVLLRGEYERALDWAEEYRVFEDRPWNVHDMYRRLDERFPDSRFVLTVRDEENWWRSLERWVTVVKPESLPRYLVHLALQELDKDAAIESFRRYNAEVVAYFRNTDPDKLMVVDFAAGVGWDALCDFLGRPTPEVEFPHANRQGHRDRPPGAPARRPRKHGDDSLQLARCIACDEELRVVRAEDRHERPIHEISWDRRLARRRGERRSSRLKRRASRQRAIDASLQRLLQERPKLGTGDLGVVCCFFNPMGSTSRLLNYRRFVEGMRRAGVALTTVELVFEGQSHQLSNLYGEVLERSAESVLWHKERLLNLGIRRLLDHGVPKIAWLDADIQFFDPNWPLRVSAVLEKENLCQVFGQVLVHRNEVSEPKVGTGAIKYLQERGRLDPQKKIHARLFRRRAYPSGYSGYGWAARAEVLRRVPLYEGCVVGGADKLMYFASFPEHKRFRTAADRWFRSANPECPSCGHASVAERWRDHFLEWAERWGKAVDGRVGYADNVIGDFNHGNRATRRYVGRKELLLRQGFDPTEDLTTNDDGCLEWASEKPRMHDDVRLYFQQRRSR